MYIIHCIPLKKGIPLERLSYYTPYEPTVGALTRVPVRRQTLPALVVGFEDARAIKALLRTNTYATKKLESPTFTPLLEDGFVRAASRTADYFATRTGAIVTHFTPNTILEHAETIALPAQRASTRAGTYEKLALQSSFAERAESYKTLIRQSFADNTSVFLMVSTIEEAETLGKRYQKGIEKYIFVLHGSLSKKEQKARWEQVCAEKHAVLVVGTPGFLSIPRDDIRLYIVERENTGGWSAFARPYADARVFVGHLAQEKNARLVMADSVLRSQTHKELTERACNELERPARRARGSCSVHVVDMRPEKEVGRKKPFSPIHEETLAHIRTALDKKEKVFVHVARRGNAPATLCNDCGTRVSCTHCGAPMVLHGKGTERFLLCHRCGARRDANEQCANCGGWELVAIGVGVDRVAETLRAAFPETNIFQIDSDTTKTQKAAEKVATEFRGATDAILIGTSMALSHLTEPIHTSIVSSLDALLTVPDFSSEEKIFAMITTLREQTTKALVVQTRTPENDMLAHARKGTIGDFINRELELRKTLKYPPYTTIIKISRAGSKAAVTKDMRRCVDLLKDFAPRVFGDFVPSNKNTYALHALLRIPSSQWPNEQLLEILRALPSAFSVRVNPDGIF